MYPEGETFRARWNLGPLGPQSSTLTTWSVFLRSGFHSHPAKDTKRQLANELCLSWIYHTYLEDIFTQNY